jgi:hypothetical protein
MAETASIPVQYVGFECSGSSVHAFAEQNTGKKLRQSKTSAILGAATSQSIIMNFGPLDGPADIISFIKFCFDRIKDFCSARC